MELEKLQIPFSNIQLGYVDTAHDLTGIQLLELNNALLPSGLELLAGNKQIVIENIKTLLIEMIHSDQYIPFNLRSFLEEKFGFNGVYLSNVFNGGEGINLNQFIILNRIERIKELISYGELNLTEISYKMHYSSIAHLSTQFKKFTGLTPMQFRKMKDKRRFPLDELINIIPTVPSLAA